MFANKIDDEGRPICPMAGCLNPVEPGDGEAFTADPVATARLFTQGVLDQPDGLVIVHKTCAG
jgi:hypothetical protein